MKLISSVDEKDINTIPFENSWTPAQLTDHVTRSINGMGEALNMPGKITDRQPDEKTNQFKNMFLNFNSKMKSPPFILPVKDVYEKDTLINKLKVASKKFIETGKTVNLTEVLDLTPFGRINKAGNIVLCFVSHTKTYSSIKKYFTEK